MLRTIPFLLAGLLLLSAGLAFADPPDANPFLLDTTVNYCTANNERFLPGVAFDGSVYLAVWTDRTNGNCIFGSRISASGEVLDPGGFVISGHVGLDGHAMVAAGDSCFLVVWYVESDTEGEVFGSRVTGTGVVLDPGGFLISNPGYWSAYPSVAFTGEHWLVAWVCDTPPNPPEEGDVYGARVSQSGSVLDPNSFLISAQPDWQSWVRTASSGTNTLVVWSNGAIWGARVDGEGQVLDTNAIRITSVDGDYPAVAWDGVNYLVAWCINMGNGDVRGARVSSSGTVIDPGGGFNICVATSEQAAPSVAFDGANYLVAWDDLRNVGPYSDVYGARVTPGAVVLDPTGIPICVRDDAGGQTAVATGSQEYFVAWTDDRCAATNVFGARISPGGTVEDPDGILVSSAAQAQDEPSAAAMAGEYLVVWTDTKRGRDSSDICGARVGSAGTLLDPHPLVVSSARGRQSCPRVARGRQYFLALWNDARAESASSVYCARVDSSGAVLDSGGIRVSTDQYQGGSLAVAWGDTSFLAVWRSLGRLVARIVYETGGMDEPFSIDDTGWGGPSYPAAAFNGTNHLVVWTRYLSLLDSTYVCGARVTPSGDVLDSTGFFIGRSAGSYDVCPSVASDGDGYLVAWLSGEYNYRVYAARVNSDGAVLDSSGIPLSPADAYVHSLAACFDGQDYVVCWGGQKPWGGPYGYDLYGARVSPSGVVVDTFPVATDPGRQLNPALALGPDGRMLLTYSGFADSINGKPANTTRIWGKLSPFAGLADGRRTTDVARAISARPNPFRTSVLINSTTGSLDHSATSVRIYDAAGRLVASSADPKSAFVATPSGYVWKPSPGTRAGVYVIRVQTAERSATTRVVFAP